MDHTSNSNEHTVDWDAVEGLVFRILELQETGEAGCAEAAVLLAQHPVLAPSVRQVLQDVSPAPRPETAARPMGVPAQLGPYVLGARLGAGGMGAVYAASDPALGRLAAVKIVRPELLSVGQSLARFERETAIIARLNHPGIVPVYAVGCDGGVPWFAMEWVQGPSLALLLAVVREKDESMLDGGNLARAFDHLIPDRGAGASPSLRRSRSWEATCLDLALQVAQALAYAHGQGVLHRDVKPGNIALDGTGRARLLDFGLARALDGDRSALTSTGMPIGSRLYTSPEQACGQHDEVGPRSDVFSLGVTLSEMLTLRSPFAGAVDEEVRRRIVMGKSALGTNDRCRLSQETLALCDRAMQTDPARRFADMNAMAEALARALERAERVGPHESRERGWFRRVRRALARKPGRGEAEG